MNDIAIRVENLGKMYHIGRAKQRHDTLRDALVATFKRSNVLTSQRSNDDIIWALKDVSFEVKRGEVVGIIGRNGAGKSTLLKILTRITEPTEGHAELHGRVGSLLEVGTGFHPELTGRENIYLNGAILGMKRVEIDRKFDEMVDFSGIEKFIDTPVKHYSSGMYVRLAFAVAAHLEPEILLVDEVLAVGDAAFQKKCLGKMGDIAGEGRTVLFVSHNLGAIRSLCSRGVWLKDGSLSAFGDISKTVASYLGDLQPLSIQDLSERKDRRGRGDIRVVGAEVSTISDSPSSTLITGQPVRFTFYISEKVGNISLVFTIYNELGQHVAIFDTMWHSPHDKNIDNTSKFVCEMSELLLLSGTYRINILLRCNGELQDHIEGAMQFHVAEGAIDGRYVPTNPVTNIALPHRWIVPN